VKQVVMPIGVHAQLRSIHMVRHMHHIYKGVTLHKECSLQKKSTTFTTLW
jgi:hypothetical protein